MNERFERAFNIAYKKQLKKARNNLRNKPWLESKIAELTYARMCDHLWRVWEYPKFFQMRCEKCRFTFQAPDK